MVRQAAVVDAGGDVVHARLPAQPVYEGQEQVPLQPAFIQALRRPAEAEALDAQGAVCFCSSMGPLNCRSCCGVPRPAPLLQLSWPCGFAT